MRNDKFNTKLKDLSIFIIILTSSFKQSHRSSSYVKNRLTQSSIKVLFQNACKPSLF